MKIKQRPLPQESWLFNNPKALRSVKRGLKQAKAGKLKKGPVLYSKPGVKG